MASKFLQEMPPPGGFPEIDYKQKIPTTRFKGKHWAITAIGLFGLSWLALEQTKSNRRWTKRELSDTRVAVHPFLEAEYDRAIMAQMRRNRDEETELMKNVDGWKVGTYYGRPIYNDGKWHGPNYVEFYTHNDMKRLLIKHRKEQTSYGQPTLKEKAN